MNKPNNQFASSFASVQDKAIKYFAKLATKFDTYNFLLPKHGKTSDKNILANLAQLFVREINKNKRRLMYYDNQFRWRNDVYVETLNPIEFQVFMVNCLGRFNVGIPIVGCAENIKKLFDNIVSLIISAEPPKTGRHDEISINLLSNVMVIKDGTISLRERDDDDYFDYVLGFDYDENARCDKFHSFLEQTQPNVEFRNVLSEYVGSVFIPAKKLNLQKMLVLKGSGNNGKSTFIDIISALVGTHNCAPTSLKMLTKGDGVEVPGLIGKLLAVDSEFSGIEDGGVFKQLVSAEKVRSKILFKNPTYTDNLPRFIAACNDLPSNMEHSISTWRRLIVVPFVANFKNPDLSFANKIIKDELPGIFKWAIDGLIRVLNREMPDIDVPKASRDYAEELKVENDAVSSFIDSEGIEKSDSLIDFVPTSEIFAVFKEYCIKNGFKVMSVNSFSRRFKNLGFTDRRTAKDRGFLYRIKKFNEEDPNAPNNMNNLNTTDELNRSCDYPF